MRRTAYLIARPELQVGQELLSLEFNRFLEYYYKDAPDLNVNVSTKKLPDKREQRSGKPAAAVPKGRGHSLHALCSMSAGVRGSSLRGCLVLLTVKPLPLRWCREVTIKT